MLTMKYLIFFLFLFWKSAPAQLQILSDSERIRLFDYYISPLSHDSMKGRATATVGMLHSAHFIANAFKNIGLHPASFNDEDYFQYFYLKEKFLGINVAGVLEGSSLKDEIIVISAHYDHIGMSDNLIDSVYNGANDNASGTAMMLYLALELKKINPKRTILFIAFSGEELGLLGSKHFVSKITLPQQFKAVLNFDMVGRGYECFITGSAFSNLQKLLNKELEINNKPIFGRRFFKDDRDTYKSYFERSDNYPFAKLKIPAHTFMCTEDFDGYYHTVGDEKSTLNFKLMSKVAEALIIAIQPLVNGEMTPTRLKY